MNEPSADDPFSAALEAEHRAIYGYGILGARLDSKGKASARTAELAHRDRRDRLIAWFAAEGREAAASAGAYSLAKPVTDANSARRLAAALEEAAAHEWRLALGYTAGDDRQMALDALIGSGVQAMRWREAAGIQPATIAFPGSPS